ncbi:MAG: nucleotide exchange factor GrpE [Acidimicrobiales bacterium]
MPADAAPAGTPGEEPTDDGLDAPAGAADASEPEPRPDLDDMEPADLEALTSDTLDRLEAVTAERDDYLDRLQRLQAEFDNYKKRTAKEHTQAGERAAARLADALLPVLDSCDAAILHGVTGVEPVFAALLGVLEKEGLERIDPLDAPFDPELHEAVLHEHAEDGSEPTVVEVLRPGYALNGQVIRAAMVKVRG